MDEDVQQRSAVADASDGHLGRGADVRPLRTGVRVSGRAVRARTCAARGLRAPGTAATPSGVRVQNVRQELRVGVAAVGARGEVLRRPGTRGGHESRGDDRPAVSVLRQVVPVAGHAGEPQARAHPGEAVLVRRVRKAVPHQGQPAGAQARAQHQPVADEERHEAGDGRGRERRRRRRRRDGQLS